MLLLKRRHAKMQGQIVWKQKYEENLGQSEWRLFALLGAHV